MNTPWDVAACRRRFPALERWVGSQEAVFFDGPAGSQVPQAVIDAMTDYLTHHNANHGGLFATSRESDALVASAHRAAADLVGCDDPQTIVFGANMTTLTLALSRAIGRTWRPGDEVIVTRLDHDANVTPWVLAARDAGATVHHVDVRPDDCTLDLEQLRTLLSSRTRLVAVGCASNATGTINPVEQITHWAHEAGAEVFLDAVHYAPHALLDVTAWNCDYLACSAYKFFGPHVGILWGRRARLESLPAYKIRPAPDDLPGRWMTGTQNHEGIVGTLAAIDYLAGLATARAQQHAGGADRGPSSSQVGWSESPRRQALRAALEAIGRYEQALARHLLTRLAELPAVRVWGITDSARLDERVPTVSITHERLPPAEVARRLAERGIFVWHGNYYALSLTEALGLEPEGMVRIGLLHYNTAAEIDRLIEALAALDR